VGCSATYQLQGSCSTNGTCTAGGSITIKPRLVAQEVGLNDFAGAPGSGYTVIVNAPTSGATLNTTSPTQATLTATTDQNYTSSVTVGLQQVPSTTAPGGSGYTVYTFAVPDNSTVQSWVQSVEQHTTASVSVTSDVSALFNLTASGSYTFYAQVNSSQTGLQSVGSFSYYADSSNPKNLCGGSPCKL